MTLVDPIGDMLTRIRNGQMRSLAKIEIPFPQRVVTLNEKK